MPIPSNKHFSLRILEKKYINRRVESNKHFSLRILEKKYINRRVECVEVAVAGEAV